MNRDVTIGQKPASILIVDDVAANLQVLTGMLDDRGYLTRPVTSGKMALLAAQNDPPDLVLLDITMPGMDGYEVCARMKANEKLKDIPVIFISALNETLDKVKGFSVGGLDYVTKPFQFEEVHARVETHLKLLAPAAPIGGAKPPPAGKPASSDAPTVASGGLRPVPHPTADTRREHPYGLEAYTLLSIGRRFARLSLDRQGPFCDVPA